LSKKLFTKSIVVLVSFMFIAVFVFGCGGAVETPKDATPKDETPKTVEDKFPEKAIEYVIHSNPGGGMDKASRYIGDLLSAELGTTAAHNNQPGASGGIATAHVLRQPKDGYTLYPMNPATIAFLDVLKNPTGGDFNEAFDWLGTYIVDSGNLIVSKEHSKWKTFEEFVQYSIDNKVIIGSPNLTMPATLVAYQLDELTDMNVTVVPYDGSPPAVTDLLGGHIDAVIMMSVSAQSIADQVDFLAQFQDENTQPDITNNAPSARKVLREMGVLAEDVDIINVASPRALILPVEVRKNYPERYKKIVDAYNGLIMSPKWVERGKELGFTSELVNWGPEKSKKEFDDLRNVVKKYEHLFK